MGSVSAATSFWWGVCRQRDPVLLITNFYKILGGAFHPPPPLFHCLSSPTSCQGMCHYSRSVIGYQTTTTHLQWDLVMLLLFLPFPLPCIYKTIHPVKLRCFPVISNYFSSFWNRLKRSTRETMEIAYRYLGHRFIIYNLGLGLLKAYT